MSRNKMRVPAGVAADLTAGRQAPQARRATTILWILAGALVLRLANLVLSIQSPFFEPLLLDPAYYHGWALRILGGDVGGVFYGLPLYPFFLAFVYKLSSQSLIAVKIVQLLLGLSTVYFVYKIGEEIADRRSALAAAVLAAIYGPLLFHEAILIPEAIAVPMYSLALYGVIRLSKNPTLKSALWVGVICGLAALTKAGVLLFVVLFAAALVFRRFFAVGAIFLAACFLTLAPVTAHNWARGHDFVPLTSHGGFNFYIGNNLKAEGIYAPPEGTGGNVESQIADSRQVAEREEGRPLKPSEVSKFWSRKAKQFIIENPRRFLWLCGRKALLFFDAREISDVDDYSFSKVFNPFFLFPWPTFGLLGPLFAVGLLAASRSLKHRFEIWLWFLSYLAGLIAFFINARYRLPMLSVFFPLAGVGLVYAYDALRRHDLARIGWSVAVFLAMIGLTQLQLVGMTRERDWTHVGDVYMLKKDYDKAQEYYQKALQVNPASGKANLAMGLVLSRYGNRDEAKEHYLKSIEVEPTAQAYNNLGLWYDQANDSDEAERLFLKAIELKPGSTQAHNNLGMIYGKRGEYEKALREFQTSVSLGGGTAKVHTNLGLVLYRLGRREEARQEWKKAVEIDPSFEEARRALSLSETSS